MADIVFNIAKGRFAHLATLPAANDGLVVIPIESAGLEADGSLRDYANLSVLLAGSTNEQLTMGRKSLGGITVTVDNAADRVDVDATDITWESATGNAIAALIVCYVPNVGTSADIDCIPLSKHDFVVTPNGGDIIAQITAGGFLRAT